MDIEVTLMYLYFFQGTQFGELLCPRIVNDSVDILLAADVTSGFLVPTAHLPIPKVKPGSYFLQMRSEFEVNLTSQLSFRCDIRKRVEQSSTPANYLLQICDFNIRFAFAFTESMKRTKDPLRPGNNPWYLQHLPGCPLLNISLVRCPY